jgi:sarcosine oxidase subunit alpha
VSHTNRLPADAKHGFGGSGIDRSKPLTFRLNGRTYPAYEGDTVLSALLAAGVDTAGLYRGEPIAVDERFAPSISPRRSARNPAQAMAMHRTPVVAGLDLVTLAPPTNSAAGFVRPLANLLTGGRTLGCRLDDSSAVQAPWLQLPPLETLSTDVVVVGGGLAGMSAAVAAARNGRRVMLMDQRTALGGDARFFGTVGDEESPETAISRLAATIANTPTIEVLASTEAFNIAGERVLAHQVRVVDGKLDSRVIRVTGPRIVLATGADERLPVFTGNRAPGVVGAVAAFNLADRFGIWMGPQAIFAGPHNFIYRMALLAADAGVTVQRVADSRTAPQSRFVDFCKASGITLASGLAVRAVESSGKGRTIEIGFATAIEGTSSDAQSARTELLIAAGTWQPRLSLWLMAGGSCAYDAARRCLQARGHLDAVRLAGSAAGLISLPACLRSGEASVADDDASIADLALDASYETPPGPMPVAPWRAARNTAFLDGGFSFAARPQQLRKDAPVMTPNSIHSLSVGDVIAAAEIGSIPLADAGVVAQERCLGPGDIEQTSARRVLPAPPTVDVPAYLAGRFGAKPQILVVDAADGRTFEPGCLAYPNSDLTDPLRAIGVVLGPAADGGTRLLVNRAGTASPLVIRDIGGAVKVVAREKSKPKAAKPA